METRLARSIGEIRMAQKLRYQVFYREFSARPDAVTRLLRRDRDAWDAACDHLLVLDQRDDQPKPEIVGTYRLLGSQAARASGLGFYSQGEFDVAALSARKHDLSFMEFGRSCVLPPWRNKRTVELLWQGCWAHVLNCGADVMIGCASLPGSDPQRHAAALSFLYHHAGAPAEWDVPAQPDCGTPMNLLEPGSFDARRAMMALPPLIKGYLRLGAMFAREAVIDRQFNTTDVLVILPVAQLNPRYVAHYGADASRHAA